MQKFFISLTLAISGPILAGAQSVDYELFDIPPEETPGQFIGSNLVVPETVIRLRDVGTLAVWMKPHQHSKPGSHASEVARAVNRQKPDLALWSQQLKVPGESK
jgi:hypothetical protein